MTTSATGRKLTDACNGVTVTFNCPSFQTPGDLKVYLLDSPTAANSDGTLLTQGTDYTIGGGDSAMGLATVTTLAAQPVGKFIRRWRSTSRRQDVEIVAGQGVPAATQEAALDRLSLVDEEHDEDIARTIRVPPGEAIGAIPTKAARAGNYAAWDADGEFVASAGTGTDVGLRTDLSANGGFALIKYKSGLANTFGRSGAAWARVGGADDANIFSFIDPLLDDAILNGANATDLAAYFQNAVDSGRRRMRLPDGDFLVSSLLMPGIFNFVFEGGGPASRLIQKAGAAGALFHWANGAIAYNEQTIRNIGIVGTNGSQHCLDTTGAGGLTVDGLYVTDVPVAKSAIYDNGVAVFAHDNRFDNIQVYSNTAGHSAIRFGPLAADASVHRLIVNGNFLVQYPIYGDAGSININISDSHPYNAGVNVVKLAGGNDWWSFIGGALDNALQDLVSITDGLQIGFVGTYFEAVQAGKAALNIGGASAGITLSNNRFQGVAGATNCIVSGAGTSDITVLGGAIAGTFSDPFSFGGARSWARGVAGYSPLGLEWAKGGVQAAAQAQNTTRFIGEGDNATEANAVYAVPYDCRCNKVFIAVSATPAAGQTFTFQARKNGANIGAPLVLNNGDFSGTIALGQSFSQNVDALTVQSTFSATSGPATVRWSADFVA